MPGSPCPLFPCPGSLLAAGLVVAARGERAAEELVMADGLRRDRLVVPRHEAQVQAALALAGQDDALRGVDRGGEGDHAAARVGDRLGLARLRGTTGADVEDVDVLVQQTLGA